MAITIVLERDAAGQPLYEIAVFDDVTARKRAEAALRESEERFRQTFELAASGIAHVTLDGHFLRVNRSLCQILGYEKQDLIGCSVKEVSHPDDRDLTDAERGRPMEIASQLLVPLAFARGAQVPAPTLEALLPLVAWRAAAKGLFRSAA